MYMDVIAHAGPVRRIIIAAIQLHRAAPPRRGLQGVGDQMGFRFVLLADLAVRVGARGIEIAQADILNAMRGGEIMDPPLRRPLCLAIDIDRIARMALVNRSIFRRAIDRGGGGEDQLFHVGNPHGLQHRLRSSNIIVLKRCGRLLPIRHLDTGGEMQDSRNRMALHDAGQARRIPDIALLERPEADIMAVAGAEIVEDDRRNAAPRQRLGGVRADIARASGYQHRCHIPHPVRVAHHRPAPGLRAD